MKIISHRGLWRCPEEKNSFDSIAKSFSRGNGVEIDVRDQGGELVISHDAPGNNSCLALSAVLSLVKSKDYPLALNIKSDGLAGNIKKTLAGHQDIDWFCFDMSVPEQLSYLKLGNPVFTRCSEYEKDPILLDYSSGVWLDSFESDWFDVEIISYFIDKGKRVCIVSPELHGRPPFSLWQRLWKFHSNSSVMLCTDLVLEAEVFFGK